MTDVSFLPSYIGVGVDIVNIHRVERIISENGMKFLNRIFTKKEIECFFNKYQKYVRKGFIFTIDSDELSGRNVIIDIASYIAKRFAAKESYSKALGCGICVHLKFKDMEILQNERGAPFWSSSTKFTEEFHTSLSMSDQYPFAMANTTLIRRREVAT
ncbi:Holo-[acyl-carrier-protein] synthase [Candidatus Fokinia solitaria]|uniref:Holo-[acyl-carrier-protein] synthase n=1 Tax=Candidatus Fokinia solitaria TaxID=1802984 RepID=A0A2U8BSB7_9RICK|nr:holo-ACP synthase [Candidatus Fokinia solitaria]AWD33256.1 Holo-[acyl-carrier-protein] synthase [Candidatus Fokinia solitaria]